jgi:hypothetical protein
MGCSTVTLGEVGGRGVYEQRKGESMAKTCESIVGVLEFSAIHWACSSTTSTGILVVQKPMARSHVLVHLLHLELAILQSCFCVFLFWDIHWDRDLYNCHTFPLFDRFLSSLFFISLFFYRLASMSCNWTPYWTPFGSDKKETEKGNKKIQIKQRNSSRYMH